MNGTDAKQNHASQSADEHYAIHSRYRNIGGTMTVRFRRSVKLFPGVKINIGKRGISTSVGVRGAHLTFGKNGTYLSTGIPGTGLSQRTKISGSSEHMVEHHDWPAQISD